MSGLLTVLLILSLSKGEVKEEPPDTVGWFDKLTMIGLLTTPLILSLSKDERRGNRRMRKGGSTSLP